MPTSVAVGDALSLSPVPRIAVQEGEGSEGSYLFSEWARGPHPGAGVVVTDFVLAERIDALKSASPSFRRAWREIEGAGVPVIIGSSDQLNAVLPANVIESRDWDGITLTWTEPDRSGIQRAVVAVRVQWLRDLHDYFGNPQRAFIDSVDKVLVREVYGSLRPALAPPPPGEKPAVDRD